MGAAVCPACATHPHEDGAECLPHCQQRATEDLICSACQSEAARNLDLILDTYAMTDEPPWPSSGGDGRAKTRPLPGGTDYMSWRENVPAVLTTWVRDWCEPDTLDARGLAGPRHGDIFGVVRWLRANLSRAVVVHPAIDDFAREIRKLARTGERLAGMVKPRGQRTLCPTHDCGREMRIDVSELAAVTTCPNCRVERSVATLLAIAARSDAWVDEETATLATGVPGSTLRRWAKAGKVARWRGLFDLGSIRQHIEERAHA